MYINNCGLQQIFNISNKHYSWRNKAVSRQALPYQTLYQTAQAECSNCVQLVPA